MCASIFKKEKTLFIVTNQYRYYYDNYYNANKKFSPHVSFVLFE